MSAKFKVAAGVLLCATLAACGGGKNNLLNPADPTTPTDPPNTSDPDDIFTITTQFIGYFIENPELNPDDYSVGVTYIQTLATPANMEDGYNFEGLNSYKFQPCQDKNMFLFHGRQRVGDPILDTYQTFAQIDNTNQTFYMLPQEQDSSSYIGAYNLGGSDYISNNCITHTLAARGKLEVYPLNTTRFAEGLDDAVISFNTANPRQVVWNYENFSQRSNVEFITVSLLHKSKIDSLNLFQPIYQAQANLALIQAQEEANIAAAQAAVDAASEAVTAAEADVATAQASVATAQAEVDTAQQKITGLNDQLAEIDRLQTIADYMAANPGDFTAPEIAAAQQAVIDAQKAYDIANLSRPQYQSELNAAQFNLASATGALNAANTALSAAQLSLANREAELEEAQASVKEAEAALATAMATYQPRLTEDVLIWQEVVPGSANSFTLPDEVQILEDDYYLLNLVAWSSENESNFVYYHSSHVFRADGQQP